MKIFGSFAQFNKPKEGSNKLERNQSGDQPYEELGYQSQEVPTDMDSLSKRLQKYFSRQDHISIQQLKEMFLRNVNEAPEDLLSVIRDYPDRFDRLFYDISERVLSVDEMHILAQNFRVQEDERMANRAEVSLRAATNPRATEEEYRLGTYAESLETQVRDAVMEFLKKGYSPVESGFKDPITGSQYIGFQVSRDMDRGILLDDLSHNARRELKKPLDEKLKRIYIQDMDDGERMRLILVPKDPILSQKDWREVWGSVATYASNDINNKSENIINNGGQGTEFREKQDKLRIQD